MPKTRTASLRLGSLEAPRCALLPSPCTAQHSTQSTQRPYYAALAHHAGHSTPSCSLCAPQSTHRHPHAAVACVDLSHALLAIVMVHCTDHAPALTLVAVAGQVVFVREGVSVCPSRNECIKGRLSLVKQHHVMFLAWLPYNHGALQQDGTFQLDAEKDPMLEACTRKGESGVGDAGSGKLLGVGFGRRTLCRRPAPAKVSREWETLGRGDFWELGFGEAPAKVRQEWMIVGSY